MDHFYTSFIQLLCILVILPDPILASHNTTLLSCLLLDTLCVCVEVVGQPFNQLMQLLAYPLMEKLGHNNTAISNYALATLKTICSCCGYKYVLQCSF